MADGDAVMAGWIASLRGLRDFGTDAATEAAPLVDKAVRATAAAGTAPDGTPWPARKRGGRALEHAADHIATAANGPAVTVTLSGPDVFHQHGVGKTIPKRQIIPDAGAGELPASVAEAAAEGARRAFTRRMGGG